MHGLLKSALCGICLLLTVPLLFGCGPRKVDIITATPIPVPQDKETKSIALGKFASLVPEYKVIGHRYSGIENTKIDTIRFSEGFLRGFKEVFNVTMQRYNYNVLGGSGDMFENNAGDAEFWLGMKIIDVTFDLYTHAMMVARLESGTGVATIDVEWQLYNTLDRKTVYRKTTHGAASIKIESISGAPLYSALQNALMQLLSDAEFHRILTADEASAPTSGAAPLDLDAYRCLYAGAQDSRTLEDVQKSVVTVQLGGAHGTGFVVSENGLIITNRHVVGDSDKVRILTHDGKKFDGRVLARNARRDVAAIAVEGLSLRPLKIQKVTPRVGEDVYAVGSPKELEYFGTVTKGVVSSFREDKQGPWIQSDAAINHGNSGGPLVNAKGNVVGISTLGREDAQGIFFFIPIGDALNTLNLKAR